MFFTRLRLPEILPPQGQSGITRFRFLVQILLLSFSRILGLNSQDRNSIVSITADNLSPQPGDIITVTVVAQTASNYDAVALPITGYEPSSLQPIDLTFTYGSPPVSSDVLKLNFPPKGQFTCVWTFKAIAPGVNTHNSLILDQSGASYHYNTDWGTRPILLLLFHVEVTPVNDAPQAVDDRETTSEDTPVVIDVVANDVDVDGDTLSVAGFTQPAHGTVQLNADGTLTYTPDADFYGQDVFTYVVSDGTATDTATVQVEVKQTKITVQGYVWIDPDKDGIKDPGESGISDVEVVLLNSDGSIFMRTITDASGKYIFEDVPFGTYYIEVMLRAAMNQTHDPDTIKDSRTKITLTGENWPVLPFTFGYVPATPDEVLAFTGGNEAVFYAAGFFLITIGFMLLRKARQ